MGDLDAAQGRGPGAAVAWPIEHAPRRGMIRRRGGRRRGGRRHGERHGAALCRRGREAFRGAVQLAALQVAKHTGMGRPGRNVGAQLLAHGLGHGEGRQAVVLQRTQEAFDASPPRRTQVVRRLAEHGRRLQHGARRARRRCA